MTATVPLPLCGRSRREWVENCLVCIRSGGHTTKSAELRNALPSPTNQTSSALSTASLTCLTVHTDQGNRSPPLINCERQHHFGSSVLYLCRNSFWNKMSYRNVGREAIWVKEIVNGRLRDKGHLRKPQRGYSNLDPTNWNRWREREGQDETLHLAWQQAAGDWGGRGWNMNNILEEKFGQQRIGQLKASKSEAESHGGGGITSHCNAGPFDTNL